MVPTRQWILIFSDWQEMIWNRGSVKRKLSAKVPPFPPSKVKMERFPLKRNKRQPHPFVFADRPIPAALRIEHLIRVFSRAAEGLVGQSNDVESQIVGRIAEIPLSDSMPVARTIVIRRGG